MILGPRLPSVISARVRLGDTPCCSVLHMVQVCTMSCIAAWFISCRIVLDHPHLASFFYMLNLYFVDIPRCYVGFIVSVHWLYQLNYNKSSYLEVINEC